MRILTNFVKDMMIGFRNLHILVLILRIGPEEMVTFDKHKAYNASAMIVLTILFLVSINLYSPANGVGFVASGITAFFSVVLIGIIGMFVNLAAPANQNFNENIITDQALARTEKWATYFVVNLTIMVLIFIALNAISTVITGKILVNILRDIFGYTFAVWFQIVLSSLLATGTVFSLCRKAGKIKATWKSGLIIFLSTNFVCSAIFFFVNYILFV
mmetsp:Transcript_12887/g.16948  ORF Transcript_12887/g.16948 Transcript_12887/m.16948 type:complete len:216 (+) Transcript_12887:384-1031(+)